MMPVWLSQMFLWSIVLIPLTYVNADKIEAFLDKIITKIKTKETTK